MTRRALVTGGASGLGRALIAALVARGDRVLAVDLADGRTIITPLAWYPRLLYATSGQRARWERAGGGFGVHWPELDEDLSVRGMLRGAPSAPGTWPAADPATTA